MAAYTRMRARVKIFCFVANFSVSASWKTVQTICGDISAVIHRHHHPSSFNNIIIHHHAHYYATHITLHHSHHTTTSFAHMNPSPTYNHQSHHDITPLCHHYITPLHHTTMSSLHHTTTPLHHTTTPLHHTTTSINQKEHKRIPSINQRIKTNTQQNICRRHLHTL